MGGDDGPGARGDGEDGELTRVRTELEYNGEIRSRQFLLLSGASRLTRLNCLQGCVASTTLSFCNLGHDVVMSGAGKRVMRLW